MANHEELLDLIYAVIDGHNLAVPNEKQLELAADTILFGDGAKLNSLGLVSVILGVEEKLAEDFGISVTIADERAFSQTRSPFRTIQSLATYLGILLKENADG